MTELNEATDYTRKVASRIWAESAAGPMDLLARALATPALVEPEDPDDLLADAWVRERWVGSWEVSDRVSADWVACRAGIRLARENPL